MIISRTPFRISFFGGGTDYPVWYRQHGGAVLSTAINKYCYLTCRYLPPFFERRITIVYSIIEHCDTIDEIVHPAVRELLKFANINRGVKIHHDGDLPARSGMGSSSAFTVGLLHALYALRGHIPSKQQLAMESIHVEQELLKETVGAQDQVVAAYGGFNHIVFGSNDDISVRPMTLSRERTDLLNSHLMLFYTGIMRTASNIAGSYIQNIGDKEKQLHTIGEMVNESIAILNGNSDIFAFGELLHESWLLKRSLGANISNPHVEAIYELARSAGALGGKLTGAGGGGFMLLFVPPEHQSAVREKLNNFLYVPFQFESSGSQIIFFDPETDYSAAELERNTRPLHSFRELEDTGHVWQPEQERGAC